MADREAYVNNIEYSRGLQEKYEYYVAGLTFTFLALSVQTASFSSSVIQGILELLGWLFLLISGFLALSRFRWQPVAHKGFAVLDLKKRELAEYKDAKHLGDERARYPGSQETISLDDIIKRYGEIIAQEEPVLARLESKLISRHKYHLYLLYAGFSSIVLSRAYQPIVDIVAVMAQ